MCEIDIDDPAEFEALMLRLWAMRVKEVCYHNGEPTPPGAKAILDGYTFNQPAFDSKAFKAWCNRNGLEFLMHDCQEGRWFLHPDDDPAEGTQYQRH